MLPSNGLTLCLSHTQSWHSALRISRESWLTRTTPPSYCVSASPRASILSMSKLFVGSSRTMMCGAASASPANTTRAFCPPERSRISIVCAWPSRPNRPKRARAFPSLSPGVSSWNCMIKSTGLLSIGRTSTKCWLYLPTFKNRLRTTSPSITSRSPISRLSSVDLPTPLGPTMAMRDF